MFLSSYLKLLLIVLNEVTPLPAAIAPDGRLRLGQGGAVV